MGLQHKSLTQLALAFKSRILQLPYPLVALQ